METMEFFVDEQGIRNFYRTWPVSNPRGVVQFAHGLGEHALRNREITEALNNAGFSVWADDHRGHGQTGMEQWGADASKLGRLGPGGHRAAVAALVKFSSVIREREPAFAPAGGAPQIPLIFIGHSWGSLMGQIIINIQPELFDAAVFTGSAYRVFGYIGRGASPKIARSFGPTPADWRSRDHTVATDFMADPYTRVLQPPVAWGIVDTLRLLGRPTRNLRHDLPLLILTGTHDRFGGERSSRKLATEYRNRSGLTRCDLIVYPEARHELFKESNKEAVFADLIAWLNRVCQSNGVSGLAHG